MFKAFAITVTALALCSCASAPRYQSAMPDSPGAHRYVLSHSAVLDQTSNTTLPVDAEKSILYHQEFGGGGAAVGLLFGPIGIVANASMIESATKQDVERLRNRIPFQPRQLFTTIAKQVVVDDTSTVTSGERRVSPYLYVTKTEGDVLLLGSALVVEQGEGATKWVGKYMYQLPVSLPLAEFDHLDASKADQLRGAAREGFSKLLAHLDNEDAHRVKEGRPIKFKSPLISPRNGFEFHGQLIDESDDVVWIRSTVGVYGFPKSQVTIKNVDG